MLFGFFHFCSKKSGRFHGFWVTFPCHEDDELHRIHIDVLLFVTLFWARSHQPLYHARWKPFCLTLSLWLMPLAFGTRQSWLQSRHDSFFPCVFDVQWRCSTRWQQWCYLQYYNAPTSYWDIAVGKTSSTRCLKNTPWPSPRRDSSCELCKRRLWYALSDSHYRYKAAAFYLLDFRSMWSSFRFTFIGCFNQDQRPLITASPCVD